MRRSVLLGPGPRLARLGRVLAGAQTVDDLAQLLTGDPAALADVELVLDLDATPLEDLGLLDRVRTRARGMRVLWTGPPTAAHRLGGLTRSEDRYLPWPLDVTTLFESGPTAVDEAAARATPVAPSVRPGRVDPDAADLEPDLARIEAILAGFERGPDDGDRGAEDGWASGTARHAGAGPLDALDALDAPGALQDIEDIEDDEDDDTLEPLDDLEPALGPQHRGDPWDRDALGDDPFAGDPAPPAATPGPATGVRAEMHRPSALAGGSTRTDAPPPETDSPAALPPWYRAQVADLADLVQRAELALVRAGEDGDLAAPELELGRLRQFARTLGFVAAPPEAGAAALDLGVLVEETLASLAARAQPEAPRPRFLFRAEAGIVVGGDKGLLAAALDAVLQTAAAVAGPDDVVRSEVLRTDAGVAEVRVDLPEGALSGHAPERILQPYGMRGRVEGIGPNALAAAGGILVGHGGDLDLRRTAGGRLVFTLRLPLRRA